jgi:hypothetical protein
MNPSCVQEQLPHLSARIVVCQQDDEDPRHLHARVGYIALDMHCRERLPCRLRSPNTRLATRAKQAKHTSSATMAQVPTTKEEAHDWLKAVSVLAAQQAACHLTAVGQFHEAGDSLQASQFAGKFALNGTMQFGNYPLITGRSNIEAMMDGATGGLEMMKHKIRYFGKCVVEMEPRTWVLEIWTGTKKAQPCNMSGGPSVISV